MILNVDHNPTAVTAVADQRGIHVAIFSVSSVWYSVYMGARRRLADG